MAEEQKTSGLDELSAARLAYGELVRKLEPDEFPRELKTFSNYMAVSAPEGATLPPAELPTVSPLELDFENPLPPPRYVVDRLLERATVNIFSGDTGAGKSIITSSLVVAAAQASKQETRWLDRVVHGTRSLVVDEENPTRLVRARLAALGLDNDTRDCVRYFAREGILIGSDSWTEWLAAEAEDHEADFIFIDTAMAATNVEVNDNDQVAELYRKLRPIAERLDLAIVILHHERKTQAGTSNTGGQGMMGARQWAGQADTHLEVKVYSEMEETDAKTQGRRRLAKEFVFSEPKVRDGEPNIPHKIRIVSEKDEETNRLLWMRVDDLGELDPSEEARALSMKIAKFVEDIGRPVSASTIAVEVRKAEASHQFKSALKLAVENGIINHQKNKGLYSFAAQEGLNL